MQSWAVFYFIFNKTELPPTMHVFYKIVFNKKKCIHSKFGIKSTFHMLNGDVRCWSLKRKLSVYDNYSQFRGQKGLMTSLRAIKLIAVSKTPINPAKVMEEALKFLINE